MEVISDDPRRFTPGAELTREDGSRAVIETARGHGRKLLVKFEGADSREAAELLRGPLYVEASELRTLDEGEFWDHELIGCEVVREAGGDVAGIVRDVQHAPAQDLLVVDTERGERLVPVVEAIVTGVDLRARKIFVDAAEGLLD